MTSIGQNFLSLLALDSARLVASSKALADSELVGARLRGKCLATLPVIQKLWNQAPLWLRSGGGAVGEAISFSRGAQVNGRESDCHDEAHHGATSCDCVFVRHFSTENCEIDRDNLQRKSPRQQASD